MRKYKHLFFDLDNTLFDFGASEKLVLHDLYENQLVDSEFSSFEEFNEIYEGINERLWIDYRAHRVNKEGVKYGRFRETLLQKNIEDESLARYMGDSFVKMCTENDTLVEGAKEVIATLYEKYDLHIVSNGFVEAQYRKLELTGLRTYFKGITLSEEIKTQKPNRQFFEHAFKMVNARKSESLVIGDSWESDIEGAINFGVDAIYFSYYGEKPKKSEIKTIFKLNELISILD
jgi:putative hydrolase of the HAD superfamily